jgi:hypothetical protein
MLRGLREANALLLAALLVGTAGVAHAEETATSKGPKILIEEKRHDLGEVWERSSYVHTFDVKNVGTEVLEIQEVSPSCGCTVAEFDSMIAPGQSGKITLEIEGDKVTGNFVKNAAVVSNDLDHPKVSISLGGSIREYISVEPRRVYLRGRHGEPVARDVSIIANDEKQAFEILDVSSNIDHKITYRVMPGQSEGEYIIKLFKNPKLETENSWGQVVVKTNNENVPERYVQVNVISMGSIVIEPKMVNFGTVEPLGLVDDPLKTEVLVHRETVDFQITDVSFTSDLYEAEIETIDWRRKYRIVVAFRPGEQSSYSDEMIISTDDPRESSIRVRMITRVRVEDVSQDINSAQGGSQ